MNVPKLRFKEFTDEWVYYKYKDIFNLNQGLQIPITERFLDYAPNRFFYITNEFLKPSSKKSYYIENPSPNVICTKEDILMTRTGNTGKVITNIAGVFHNNFFRIKYNPKNFNKDFICCILNQNKIQNKILTLAGSSTIPDLNHKDFYSIKSRFPKLKEQEKIAKFINTVDKKIENIENTISSLENQKKGLLQQIFSQKLRFKDKNGNNYPNWEKKKLGKLLSITSSKRVHEADWTTSGIPFYRARDIVSIFNNKPISKIYISEKLYEECSSSCGKISENDLLVTGVGTIGIPYLVKKSDKFYFKDGNIIWLKNSPAIYGKYLFYIFISSYVQKQINMMTGKGTVGTYTIKNAKDTNILLSCLEEQTKIANFLSAFDRKLENQKAQLEHWKQIKKGLLQQMFV